MLEVSELHKRFGAIHAVRGVSFQAQQGVLGVLGPNGAGKTTTMRMITGFLPPTSGTAIIEGHDIVDQPVAAKRLIGYLPESAPAYMEMTVWNYLDFIADVRGFSGGERRRMVGETVERCYINPVRHQTIGTLSKGYRQRVGLAQAVLHNPPVLIMDEPTDGLDPNQKQVVRAMIRDMARDKVVVLSTHILEEVEAVCGRVLIICAGSVVFDGTPAELKARSPRHGAVELRVSAGAEQLRPALQALPAAERVEAEGDRLLVYPRASAQLMDEVVGLIRKQPDCRVVELKVLDGRLDEVFGALTAPARRAS
ncbi:MAG: ABC transporter ATP-binding protein [Kiritimatiellia bacterium]|nr:ATP-binding cassette domain-containing protein [Lentisphaerota bacterium]